jgi:hypothetical protein
MNRTAALLAVMAAAMLAWPAAARPARTLSIALCNGGRMDIPLDGDGAPDPGCAIACHAALGNRKRSG